MQKQNQILVTFVASVISSRLGYLFVPVLLLVLCNFIDYFTGLCAAKYRPCGGISSYQSIRGIVKKVCMWLLVVVGCVVDILLQYTMSYAGVEYTLKFLLACAVAIWLICNELISILENMKDIGVNIPGFLLPIVSRIKSSAENDAETIVSSEKEQEE